MECAPFSPVRLMYGSGCALSPSSEQILCCSKRYQRNSTYLNSFFLENKLLVSFLRSNYPLSFSLQVCFLFLKYKYSINKMHCVFVSLNAPCSPGRLMYENKCVRRLLLMLRLIARCTLWSEKYGRLIKTA